MSLPRQNHHVARCFFTVRVAGALIGLLLASGCFSRTVEPTLESLGVVGTANSILFQTGNWTSTYRLISAPLETATTSGRKLPLSLLAPGSEQARVVDQRRNVVRIAPPDGTIFALEVSPSGEHVLLDFGDAKYSIAAADTLDDLSTLPARPPIDDDVTGFRWFFLDDIFLFGSSALRSTDTEGRMASEIDSLPPRATLLYLYHLESEKLIPVAIDDSLPPVFSIHEVSGWNVTLLTYDSDDLVGATIVHLSK